jgi:hypothetical protein
MGISMDLIVGDNSRQRAHAGQIGRIERLRFGHKVGAVLGNGSDADFQIDRDPLIRHSGDNQFQQGKFAPSQICTKKIIQCRLAGPGHILPQLRWEMSMIVPN